MGLLDRILGGMAGTTIGRSPLGGSGGGMSRVLVSLLPVVLGMLANRQGGAMGRGMGPVSPGGGLGDLFGAGGGGLGGLIEQFTRKGYGSHADSWVGTGSNEPLSGDAVSHVFGDEQLSRIAEQAGVSPDEARDGLSELLPEVVDHFTPQGQMPVQDELLSSIDDYLARSRQ